MTVPLSRSSLPTPVMFWLVLLVTLLALCFLRCRQAQMLGIIAGISFVLARPRCSTSWPVWIRKTVTWYFPVMTQRPFPVVQTVLRTLEIPQSQFVARWSMSSSCCRCRIHRCISGTWLLTCPLCATSGAGSDVYGGFGIIYLFSTCRRIPRSVLFVVETCFSTSPLYLAVTSRSACPGIWKNFTAFST